MFKLRVILVIFLSFIFVAQPQLIFAQTEINNQQENENFITTINSTYTVDLQGMTKVSHNIKITNNTPAFYLKQYALKTSYFGLNNIEIKNTSGKTIPANIVTNETGTSIGITFEDEVVGQGKSRNFLIEYNNPDLATIAGRVLEVHIPQLGDAHSFSENKTTLITPSYFSIPVRVSPEPLSVDFKPNGVTSIFLRPNGETISAIYGQEQVYKMTLRYSLENPTNSPAIAQISLPPDTPFQKMHYHALDPLPTEMKKDLDGNWIATYTIPASAATVVHLTAEAKITLDPNPNIPFSIPSNDHTKSLKFWESNDSSIIEKAQQYKTPEQIYNYIIDTLNYSRDELDINTISRLGAVKAFENPNLAVCQEFTDTFIAMARANNIPARRLIGYAYTENSVLRPLSFEGDILHSWPEYYDSTKNIWIPIDPTWGDTTGGIDYFHQFDLNHIVFAINGVSSNLPHPAGSYKIQSEDTKDVEVSIGELFPQITPQISTKMVQKKLLFIPIPGMYEMYVRNDTGQAWYDMQALITSLDSEVNVEFNDSTIIKTILPFQTIKYNVTFFTKKISIPKDSLINVNYKDVLTGNLLYESSTQSIKSGPEIIKQIQDPQAIIYLGIGAVVITLVTGSVLVLKQKWQSSVRRQSEETQEPT
ncbi:MAG: transglutaminase domain-containing protein [Pseudomonadales bacterium]|nr:transglutaminase domain-containing protein [Pseudomonadales bacterium]